MKGIRRMFRMSPEQFSFISMWERLAFLEIRILSKWFGEFRILLLHHCMGMEAFLPPPPKERRETPPENSRKKKKMEVGSIISPRKEEGIQQGF